MRPHLFSSPSLATAAVALAASLLGATSASAAPEHEVCVPEASGVPTMEGPPQWFAWTAGALVSEQLDDPRWLGATGQSFELGSAKAPLHTRAVWQRGAAGVDYLYLSFIVDIEALMSATATSPRDIFLGFRRPGAPAGQRGYIFQFHLNGDPAAGLVTPEYCARYENCDEVEQDPPRPPLNFWRVFADNGNPGTCGVNSADGAKYEPVLGADDATPPFTWMGDAVRYWKLSSTAPVFLKNRWAVQVRIPIVATGEPLSAGIERDSTFWYQATAKITGAGGGDYMNLAWWPRELTTPICPNTSIQDFLIHEEIGNTGTCTKCSPDKASKLNLYSGARPGTCDKGLRITSAGIGTIFEAPAATDFSTAALRNKFEGLKPDGTKGTNTVIAQVENTDTDATTGTVTAPILARFRLAGWGAAPWSTSDPGRWKDMRVAENGVCATGASPSCSPTTIAPGGKAAITFRWQIGDDLAVGGIGASEYCKYGLAPPAGQGTCGTCTCSATERCDVTSGPGVRSSKAGGGFWPCVSSYYKHDQCMLVELSAPNGGVDFETQSSWNNMRFGEMSILEREALIDARGLPVAKGQTEQDIYLLAMPRNMPEALPGGTITGNQLVAQQAFAAARRITDGYRDSYLKLPAEERILLARRLKHPIPSLDELERDPRAKLFGEQFIIAAQVRTVLARDDYQRAGKLLELAGRAGNEQLPAREVTQELVDVVGPSLAAEIVPTLEIYAFYRRHDVGTLYLPMTSFSVFLSHQGAMNGINWEIDGATRVGLNVYRLRVPVEHARRIRVRSQAIEPGELVQRPGDPGWPGGGCCGARQGGVLAGVNNFTPTLLAGMFCFGRRRRRKGAKSSVKTSA